MTYDTGFLLVRLIIGLAIAAHGAQKLFGWFGGYGIKGTGGFFETVGFRPGAFFATAAGLSEFIGGALIALGLFGPAGPMLVIATMIVAIFSVHLKNGFFGTGAPGGTGYELNALYVAGAVAIAVASPGAFSLDSLFGLGALHQPAVIWTALALGVIGGFANLALRRVEAHASTSSA